MPTHPGIHKDFEFDPYSSDARRAIGKISQSFYVTKSFRPVSIGNSTYTAILARPTDEFSVYVNADRELLFIFSEYTSFEIRTLEAFDHFYAGLDSARIDRSIRFLVSDDEQIETKIQHYLNQTPEYPVMVPITFQNLLRQPGNPMLVSTRRNFLLRDLFGYQNPLREETFFFGRQKIVIDTLDLAKSGQSSSLFGLRKSGKTSTIYALMRKAKSYGCTPIFIDCQDPAVHSRRYEGLLHHILTQIRKAVGNSKPILEFKGEIHDVSIAFREHLTSALGQTSNKILLVFDEIENISPRTAASEHWRSGRDPLYFWQILRSFIQGDKAARVSICLVGTSPQLLEIPEIDEVANPMYLFVQKRFMPSLTFDETREMIQRLGHFMGMEFTDDIIIDLHRDYGGHPFFTRQVCSRIHQLLPVLRPITVSKSRLIDAQKSFGAQLATYLADIVKSLRDFYPEEAEVLRAVAQGDSVEAQEYLTDAPELIDHLIGYDLVKSSGGSVELKINAIRSALKIVFSDVGVEGQWKEISRRRNALEVSIRRSLFYFAKMIGFSVWEDILKECIPERRHESFSSTDPSVLLGVESSPLYFSDLLFLIKDERVLPYLGEDRRRILTALNRVNRERTDAHAKALGSEDFDALRREFEFLEGIFATV
jgi:hypothetical protein